MGRAQIQRGAKVDVPAWLAASSNFRQLVRVETPKTMGPRARAHWLADPTVINLNDYAPFFYLFGLKVSEMCALCPRDRAAVADHCDSQHG